MKKTPNLFINLNNMDEIDLLTNEQAGAVLKNLMHYQLDQRESETMDAPAQIVFNILKRGIDYNNEKYADKCKKNAENGRLGGIQKGKNSERYRTLKTLKENEQKTPEKIANLANATERYSEQKNDVTESPKNAVTTGVSDDYSERYFDTQKTADFDKKNSEFSDKYINNKDIYNNNLLYRGNIYLDRPSPEENSERYLKKEQDSMAVIDNLLAEADRRLAAKKEPEELLSIPESASDKVDAIIKAWNANDNVVPIQSVVPCSQRDDNLRRLIDGVGYETVYETLACFEANKFFTPSNKQTFDWVIKPNNFQKVCEGNYKELWKRPRKNGFNNFGQRDNDDDYKRLEQLL